MKIAKEITNILQMFDTESASESGSWLHLTKPGTDGELAYADKGTTKPLRIKLKGPDSSTWTAFQRKAIKASGKKDIRTAKEIAREDSSLFARMTLETENIPGLKLDEEEANGIFEMYLNYKDIRMQALRWVMNQENFTLPGESD
jgi:hypothetical protein